MPEKMPESRAKGLNFREDKQPAKLDANIVAVFRMSDYITTYSWTVSYIVTTAAIVLL